MIIIRNIVRILFFGVFILVSINGNMVIWLGIFIAGLAGAFVFGRFYCGYICPMNTVMGITDKLSKKLNWQTKKVPKILRSPILPWIVLGLMILTMMISKNVWHLELPIFVILLILSVLVTFRYEEWVFHNHICPYGALLSLTGKHARFSTKVSPSLCIGCKKCETVCPSQAIQVNTEKKASVNQSICHQCQSCNLVCPKDAIAYK